MPFQNFTVGLREPEAAAVQSIAKNEERGASAVLRRLVVEALADKQPKNAE